MATGGGHTPLKESMSVLGVPIMNKSSVQHTERDIGEWWTKTLEQAMIEAGQEEKRLANDYHQGVPAITVIVDGGWSKRSHKHSYNAKSGVGIIIGHATGKVLYVGVRNMYCSACSQGIPQDRQRVMVTCSACSANILIVRVCKDLRAWAEHYPVTLTYKEAQEPKFNFIRIPSPAHYHWRGLGRGWYTHPSMHSLFSTRFYISYHCIHTQLCLYTSSIKLPRHALN